MGIKLDAGLDATVELGRKLDSINNSLLSLQSLWLRRPVYQIVPPIVKTSAASAAAWMFVDCGGPNAGRVWDVHLITVCADDPSAQLANTSVIAFISTGDFPQDGATCPTNLFVVNPGFQQAIPVASVFGHGQFTLRYPQHLGIGIKGMANSTNTHTSFGFKNWDEDWLHLPFASP